MSGKPWYQSLTFLFNAVALPALGATGATDAGQAWIAAHPAVAAVLGIVGAAVNILLRFKTNAGVQ